MRKQLKLLVPFLVLAVLLLSGCELQRGGEEGDITIDTPEISTPAAVETATTAQPTEEPAAVVPTPTIDQAAQADDIDPIAVPASVPPPPGAAEPNKVLVKLSPQAAVQARKAELGGDDLSAAGLGSLEEKMQQFGQVSVEPVLENPQGGANDDLSIQSEQVNQLYAVTYEADVPPEAVAQVLEQDPAVEYAEPNFIAGIAGSPNYSPLSFTPNDPYYRYQWHFDNIQMPTAWDSATGQGVVVAIVDTGIDFGTPDLANTARVAGYNFVDNSTDATDDQSHGTHVAGTVAQSTNNSVGIAGVAYNSQLMPVKVLGSNGNGTYENIIKGIIFAADRGAKVINMSLAGSAPSESLRTAVQYAHDKGVVLVAAAGNANGPVSYPAAYDEYVIAVSAVGFDNARAPYSNFGPEVDIAAPGGNIDQDLNNDGFADGVLQQTFKADGSYSYLFFEGTSMASPHVAAVTALLLEKKPNASPAEIESILTGTARNLGNPNEYGAGLVQAADALASIAGPTPDTPTPTNTPEPSATVTTEPPTDTPTPTNTPEPSATVTTEPPTDTPTPTPTNTPEPSATVTTQPPTDTPTPTPTYTPEPPTVTPTSTTPPLPEGELITNSSFETDEAWVFGDTPVRGHYDTEVVRTGSRSAKLGITDGQDRYSYTSVWQKVTIPAEAKQAKFTAYVYPVSQDQFSDFQNILILDQYFRVVKTLSRGLSNSQTWDEASFDLSDMRGQTFYVYFGVFNRGYSGKPTAMYIDDVSLTWSR